VNVRRALSLTGAVLWVIACGERTATYQILSHKPDLPSLEDDIDGSKDPTSTGGSLATGGSSFASGGSAAQGSGGDDYGNAGSNMGGLGGEPWGGSFSF